MGFDNKNINGDKSFFRTIILSTLGVLRDSIELEIDYNKKVTLKKVPIFFSLTGDERYLQDKFLEWMSPECAADCQKAEGNYDPIPRGVLQMENSSIVTDSLRNPHIRMERNVEEKGDISSFNTYVKWIPFVITFKLDFLFDTMIDVLLIKEQMIEKFYKFIKFDSYWKGMNITSCLQFPEDTNIDKTFEFSAGEDFKNKMEITLEVETYMPIFDKKNEFFSGKSMHTLTVNNNNGDSLDIEKPITNLQNN